MKAVAETCYSGVSGLRRSIGDDDFSQAFRDVQVTFMVSIHFTCSLSSEKNDETWRVGGMVEVLGRS
jgi:hypothetical protein